MGQQARAATRAGQRQHQWQQDQPGCIHRQKEKQRQENPATEQQRQFQIISNPHPQEKQATNNQCRQQQPVMRRQQPGGGRPASEGQLAQRRQQRGLRATFPENRLQALLDPDKTQTRPVGRIRQHNQQRKQNDAEQPPEYTFTVFTRAHLLEQHPQEQRQQQQTQRIDQRRQHKTGPAEQ